MLLKNLTPTSLCVKKIRHSHILFCQRPAWDKDNPDRFSQNTVMRFATFAQVRFFLEFRNQKYVTGSGPDTRCKATRSQSQSRTVYVIVDM